MTLGDLVTYIFFIGIVAAPLVSIASIGTQITEAFAGLDRIREVLEMPTEVQEDAQRAPVGPLVGTVAFDDVWFEYNPGQPVLRGVSFEAPRRHDHGARRLERLGQEHAHRPGDGVQPADAGPRADRRPRPGGPAAGATTASSWRRCCRRAFSSTARLPRTSATPGRARRATRSSTACRVAHCDEFVSQFPAGLRHHRRRARREALGRPAAARVDRARDSRRTRASSSSTRPRRASTARASR